MSIALLLLGSVLAADKPLPRVLILGDSVYNEPSRSVSKAIKERAKVVWQTTERGEVFNSTTLLKNLDKLLGKERWDVIHLNAGLGDLVYRAPGMKSHRVMPRHVGGVVATSPGQYEKNLQAIIKRLKATGAKLIWASTTPIRHSTSNVFEKGSEVQYNAIAAKVMKQHGVPINDMYSHVKALINMDKPASHGVDPYHFDRKPIHEPIVAAIDKALNPPAPADKLTSAKE